MNVDPSGGSGIAFVMSFRGTAVHGVEFNALCGTTNKVLPIDGTMICISSLSGGFRGMTRGRFACSVGRGAFENFSRRVRFPTRRTIGMGVRFADKNGVHGKVSYCDPRSGDRMPDAVTLSRVRVCWLPVCVEEVRFRYGPTRGLIFCFLVRGLTK